jgi:hypothetical protein
MAPRRVDVQMFAKTTTKPNPSRDGTRHGRWDNKRNADEDNFVGDDVAVAAGLFVTEACRDATTRPAGTSVTNSVPEVAAGPGPTTMRVSCRRLIALVGGELRAGWGDAAAAEAAPIRYTALKREEKDVVADRERPSAVEAPPARWQQAPRQRADAAMARSGAAAPRRPPRIGERIEVWWPFFTSWYGGRVDTLGDEKRLIGGVLSTKTHVVYDDGDMRWHNLDDAAGGDTWRYDAAQPPFSHALFHVGSVDTAVKRQYEAAVAAQPNAKGRCLEVGAPMAARRPEV